MTRALPFALSLLIAFETLPLYAASDPRATLLADLEAQGPRLDSVALSLWDWAEVGYQEVKSSALLQDTLQDAGFRVTPGVAGMPTAFVAEYGEGPGPRHPRRIRCPPGHHQTPARNGCRARTGRARLRPPSARARWGRPLLKNLMAERGLPGRLRVYGTPGGGAQARYTWFVRALRGCGCGASLARRRPQCGQPRHQPGQQIGSGALHGQSAHAAAAPSGAARPRWGGSHDLLVNLMREHVPERTRMHYVITSGGKAPNVVPDFAEVYLYVRHPEASVLAGLWDRVLDTAQAAALGTGTEVELEVMHGNHALLPNETLARAMHRNLSAVGGYRYSEAELAFALTIEESFGDRPSELGLEQTVLPLRFDGGAGSTDVGDVSWVVPTTGLRTATWVPGTSAHSWQAIAAGGTSIGLKGMMVAAKTLALTGYDLLNDEALRIAARAEFEQRRGPNFTYVPLLGNRSPPLDYRR